MAEQFYYECEQQICHRTHKIIKITLPNQQVKCLKIFNLRNDKHRVEFYKAHFEHVKDWFKQRFSGNSNLKALFDINIDVKQPKATKISDQLVYLKVTTKFIYHSQLYQFYTLNYQNPLNSDLAQKEDTYMYYFLQFFQLIWRGGSIINYMYIPQNIFISRPGLLYGSEIAKLYLNYSSTSGFPLLFFQESIANKQLQQIFPILPSNLFELMKDKRTYQQKLNRILKMKAFAWNILCFILRYVPNLLIFQTNLQPLVTPPIVREIIQRHLSPPGKIFMQFFSLSDVKDKIQIAENQTGIKLSELFTRVLVNNCQDVDWNYIYSLVFLQNKQATKRKNRYQSLNKRVKYTVDNMQSVSKRILQWMWSNEDEKVKQFYKFRSIPPQSIIYFLIRSNVNFKSIMEHLNVLQFIDQSISVSQFGNDFPQFGDKIAVHLQLMQDVIKNIDNTNFKTKPIPYSQKIPKIPQPPQHQIHSRLNDPFKLLDQFSRKITKSNADSHVSIHQFGKILSDIKESDISSLF